MIWFFVFVGIIATAIVVATGVVNLVWLLSEAGRDCQQELDELRKENKQ